MLFSFRVEVGGKSYIFDLTGTGWDVMTLPETTQTRGVTVVVLEPASVFVGLTELHLYGCHLQEQVGKGTTTKSFDSSLAPRQGRKSQNRKCKTLSSNMVQWE